MSEAMRQLLYPLGFAASMAFGGRFVWQWMVSELRRESVVTKIFWQLSLGGNLLLWTHSIIQAQYHVCILQAVNGVIAWRNINLMQKKQFQLRLTRVCLFMSCIMVLTTALFVLMNGENSWFRIPLTPWQTETVTVAGWWHLVGSFGLVLFSTRFWIQWWQAEKSQISHLGPLFWWISLVGQSLQLLYFAQIHDLVNLLGPLFAMIPYVRNLMLLRKASVN